MKILLLAFILTVLALGVAYVARAQDDNQGPEDPFSGYIGFECNVLGDDATPGTSSFSIDPNGTMLLQCTKHLYKAEWVQNDVSPASDPVKNATWLLQSR